MAQEVLMGYTGVDSGQLLICDPCYIDSEWEKEDFEDIRIFEHKYTKDRLQYKVDFKNFQSPIDKYEGKCMNDLLNTGEWIQIKDHPVKNSFSYNGCCKETLSDKQHGQLNYKLGHAGAGVVFSTIIGDGMYPVIATYNDEGYLVSVRVDILSEDED